MSETRIRRFSRFAITLHWLVAIPYLVLFASGAMLMLNRIGWVRWIRVPVLQRVHRWVGIALIVVLVQTFIVGMASGSIRRVLADLREWLRLGTGDLLWLLLVPLNIAFPSRVHLPAAGRYNAGQKLHGLFIVVALCTFSVSGGMMLLRPGDLRFWIIHSWLFFGAAAFLALHLFLGLINPPTRKALRGIFTGVVARDYLREHHALLLEPDEDPAAAHAVVSPRAIAGTTFIILVAAAIVLGEIGVRRSAANVTRLTRMDHPLISPGPLAAAHADDPRNAHCGACHVSMTSPPDSACLACHGKVATVMRERAGFHGKLTGSCISCHADHRGRDVDLRPPLNRFAFTHDAARFVLKGEHKALHCDQCHVQHAGAGGQERFIGLRFDSCTDCHANPHDSPVVTDCTRCHSEHGWTGRALSFRHDRDARFKLDQLHAKVDCTQCHSRTRSALRLTPLAQSCEECHKTIADGMAGTIGGVTLAADPHMGRVRCVECHAPDRAESTPAQLADACAKCHNDRYRNLFFDWRRSLDERVARHSRDSSTRANLAREIGVHNVSAAIRLLDESPAKNP